MDRAIVVSFYEGAIDPVQCCLAPLTKGTKVVWSMVTCKEGANDIVKPESRM